MVGCKPHAISANAELDELAELIDGQMGARSGAWFVRPTLSFVRLLEAPRVPVPVPGRAAIAVLAQGTKRLHVGQQSFLNTRSECLVSTTTAPAQLEVLEARPQRPLLGMSVDFDWPRLACLMLDMREARRSGLPAPEEAVVSVAANRALIRALLRLAALACADSEWGVLGDGALAEVYYWALRSEAGDVLRRRIDQAGNFEQIARAVRFIEAHLAERIDVAAIAKAAALSASGLHAHFKAVTAQSPMQYVKRRRLEAARARVAAGESLTVASLEVGYTSLAQFSRDFRQHFGLALSRWKRSRAASS